MKKKMPLGVILLRHRHEYARPTPTSGRNATPVLGVGLFEIRIPWRVLSRTIQKMLETLLLLRRGSISERFQTFYLNENV